MTSFALRELTSLQLHTTADQARCEHMQEQLQAVARPGARYRCETLVAGIK